MKMWNMRTCVALLVVGCLTLRAEDDPKAAGLKASSASAKWILSQANDDGTFGKGKTRKQVGIVAMSMLAAMGSPERPTPANTPALAKAAEYIAANQQPNGAISVKGTGYENYDTSLAVLALVATKDPKYAPVLEKAQKYILSLQMDETKGFNKEEHWKAYGGIGYGGSRRADLNNLGYALDALNAMNLPKDHAAFKNATIFIRRCQDSETNDAADMKGGKNSGGFVYFPGDSEFGTSKGTAGQDVPNPYGNMTYIGARSLVFCNIDPNSPELQAAWKWIKNNYSVKEQPNGKGTEGYYCYLMAFAKAFAAMGTKEFEIAGGSKVNWAKDLASHLATLQKPDGSYVNPTSRFWEDDPLLTTGYATIAINLCNEALK